MTIVATAPLSSHLSLVLLMQSAVQRVLVVGGNGYIGILKG
jgi:hypothetical protein